MAAMLRGPKEQAYREIAKNLSISVLFTIRHHH
jgi:hypothetical protein